MKDITDLLDEAAERMERGGASGPASMGYLAYASADDVRLMKEAANYIRILCGEPPKAIRPPPELPSRAIIYAPSGQ